MGEKLRAAEAQVQFENASWEEKLLLAEEQVVREKAAREVLLSKTLSEYEADISRTLERSKEAPCSVKNAGGTVFEFKGGRAEIKLLQGTTIHVSASPDESLTHVCQLSIPECAKLMKICDMFDASITGAMTPEQIKEAAQTEDLGTEEINPNVRRSRNWLKCKGR